MGPVGSNSPTAVRNSASARQPRWAGALFSVNGFSFGERALSQRTVLCREKCPKETRSSDMQASEV